MNILHINNFHYLRGGSEAVYFNTANILEKHGHRAIYFSMSHPKNLPCDTKDYFVSYVDLSSNGKGIQHQSKTAFSILYSFEAKRYLSKLLDNYHVDIAHLHNIYHEISPSIIDVLKKRAIPMVMTLHDYKMVCASYSMLANEKTCEACAGGKYFNAVKKQCVKGSLAKSILATLEQYLHNKILAIYDKVDIFISPSLFLKNKLRDMGFKREIIHLPNFIDMIKFKDLETEYKNTKKFSIVYFGRLSSEKGLWTLLEAAKILKTKVEVKIIGDGLIRGGLEEKVKMDGIYNVKFLGYMKGEALYKEIKRSMAVVLPSECYENNPMSVLEAFALGKTVIGSRIGGIPELVKDNETGLTFEPRNAEDLSEKIRMLLSDSSSLIRMGENAQGFVENEFSLEKYYQGLMEIYHRAVNGN